MKSIRSILLLMILSTTAFLDGCGGGSDIITIVQGTASDGTGAPLAGVAINVGSANTTTTADGTYSLNVSPGANLKVVASKTGLIGTFKMVTVADGQNVAVNFTLLAVGKTNVLAGMSTSQTVADSARGATVTLPAGSMVIDGTNTVVDDATVEVTNALPTDANYTGSFPGLFVGTQSGADLAIESFGFVRIEVTSGGQKCNLGAGKTADIAIPVSAGADPGTATIDLWSLDEVTGKWVLEGQATRDATGIPVVYRATVNHFSSYNLDRAIPNAIPFTITVKDAAGVNVAGASVLITSTNTSGGVWEGRGMTGADGAIRFPTVAPGTVSVSVVSGNQAGNGYGYDIVNGEATMTITLFTAVQKSISVVYDDGTGEKPAANISVSIFSEGSAGHDFVNGTTNALGVARLNIKEGLGFYNFNASISVDGITYSISDSVSSVGDIPTKWVLTKVPIAS